MVKKLMDTVTKTEINAAKTPSKRVVQKTAEARENLIGNKIADKITLLGKTKSKEKEKERQEMYMSLGKTKSKEKEEERKEIYISLYKRQQIIDDLRLF